MVVDQLSHNKHIPSFRNAIQVICPLGKRTDDLNSIFCSKTDREGVLCGKCKQGFGVAVNDENFKSGKFNHTAINVNWLFYLFTEFAPTTLLFATVFALNMTLTSGPLNLFLIFCSNITQWG